MPWVQGAVIDSRKVHDGDLYIPIVGVKNDGHQFIESAVTNGASAVLIDAGHLSFIKQANDAGVIQVESTIEALKQIACANRRKCAAEVISITGSSGKTTTKDIIASVLSVNYKTMKTQGNFNNEFGIPQTLLQMTADDQMAVVEMGMSHRGEITRSIWEVLPHIAVITNIGSAHLENLKTKQNTLLAKKEIFSTLGKNDVALINGDDSYLRGIHDEGYPIVRVGIEHDDLDLQARNVHTGQDGISFCVDHQEYRFGFPGIHNVYNCLMAIWIGRYYKMSASEIQKGFDVFIPSGNRMKTEDLLGVHLIDDSYNANPESMKAAMNTMGDLCIGRSGRKVAVLGDMMEIGMDSQKKHWEIGQYAAGKMDMIVAVGQHARAIAAGAREAKSEAIIFHVANAKEAAVLLKKEMKAEDTVLIKASHGMELGKIVDILKED
ncbi:MAG: UDP-N-acetylmuramoyl-tripeptide--D-alanyl-D-alanine ligase [Eubacteriaceae bacterium]|nr:UDP-N-acetylmuramoyl-tripeptide--D-alanyl-D-alanine ligase [Eubacteriaceae bacterium]